MWQKREIQSKQASRECVSGVAQGDINYCTVEWVQNLKIQDFSDQFGAVMVKMTINNVFESHVINQSDQITFRFFLGDYNKNSNPQSINILPRKSFKIHICNLEKSMKEQKKIVDSFAANNLLTMDPIIKYKLQKLFLIQTFAHYLLSITRTKKKS